jgi:Ca2+-binding RTX toxin-like protein
MASHALNWLVNQYRCVLHKLRLREYVESHPQSLTARADGGTPVRSRGGVVERLEDRVMLSAANPVVTGTGSGDNFVIKRVGGDVQVSYNAGLVTQSFNLASIRTLTVDGQLGADTFTFDMSGGDPYPSGGIHLVGGDGNDTFTGSAGNDRFTGGPGNDSMVGGGGVDIVDESADPFFYTADISLSATSITFSKPSLTEIDQMSGIDKIVAIGKSLTTGTFTGQVVFMSGMPQWVEQGPGPANNGYSRLGTDTPDERLVIGAVQTLVADPTDANIMYAGTVNGGIWKTENGGTIWRPLTDQFPTLAISSMAIDLADHETIYAGTGSRSSLRNEGGQAAGILKSTDAGETWKLLGQDKFNLQRVTGIVASGMNVVATVDVKSDDLSKADQGLFRSTNGGNVFLPVTLDPDDNIDNDGNGLIDERVLGYNGVANGGTGYKVGDLLSITSPGPSIPTRYKVFSVSATGAVTAIIELNKGLHGEATVPASPAAATGGSGTGATFKVIPSLSEPGPVTDMAYEDLGGGNARIFVAAAGRGVYRSNDTGATWSTINGTSAASSIPVSLIQDSTRIRLAVHPKGGPNPIYVGLVGQDSRVSGFFRAEDFNGAWKAMDLPGESGAANDKDKSLHPGGQGDTHFSIVAHPTDDHVVFVGGDSGPQVSGVFTGRLFRGNSEAATGDQWTSLVNGNANDTSPHPDSRNMVFVGNDLIELDDGGIYKLTDPDDASDNRRWSSLNGNLRVTEFVSVAYDAKTNRIIGGAQDNGVVLQTGEGSLVWKTVLGGDGEVVNVGRKANNDSLMYYTVQRLGFFTRIINADPPSKKTFDLEVNDTAILVDDDPWKDVEDVNGDGSLKDDGVPFRVEYALNAVDPEKFMIGSRYIYESNYFFDIGEVFTGNDVSTDLDVWGGPVGRKVPKGGDFEVGPVTTMTYGGFALDGGGNRVGDAEVTYFGTEKGELWMRRPAADRAAGEKFKKTNWAAGARSTIKPLDIVLHPDDWKQVFVVGSDGHVWHGKFKGTVSAAGRLEFDWTDLTGGGAGQLAGAQGIGSHVQTITLFKESAGANPKSAADDTLVLLVGGLGGVWRTRLDLGTLPAGGGSVAAQVWTEYGQGLPNVVVSDLRYDAEDDFLLAGTLGRGAWAVPHASDTLKQDSILRVEGRASADGTIKLVRDQDSPWMLNIFLSDPGGAMPANPSAQVLLSSIGNILLSGSTSNDTFQLDRTNGPIFVPGSIVIHGNGGASDKVEFKNSGTLSGNVAANGADKWLVTAKDPFGVERTVGVEYTSIPAGGTPSGEIALGDTGMRDGLDSSFDATGRGATDSMHEEEFAGFDADSVPGMLNRSIVPPGKEPDDRSAHVVQVNPDGLAQIESGNSFLRRFLTEGQGGIDLAKVIAQGPAALRDALQALDPSGTVTMTPAGAVDFSDVEFDINLSRSLQGIIDLKVLGDAIVAQLGIGAGDPLVDAIRFSGNAEASADVRVNLAFGMDAGGFYLKPDAGVPEFAIGNIRLQGDAAVKGDFGFLGVKVDNPSVVMQDGVELRLELNDPGGGDGKIRVQEMARTAPGSLMSFALHTPPPDAIPDLTLTANLNVLAEFAGFNLTLAETPITMTWNDMSQDKFDLQVGGADATALLAFLKLRPDQLMGKLDEFKAQLGSLAGNVNVDLPFLNLSFENLVNIIPSFDQGIFRYLHIDAGVPSFSNAQDLAAVLLSSINNRIAIGELALQDQARAEFRRVVREFEDMGFTYDAAEHELTYTVDFRKVFDRSETLSFDFDLPAGLGGIDFSALADIAVDVGIKFTLGIDFDDINRSNLPGSLADAFFIKDPSLSLSADLGMSGVNARGRFGFVSLNVFDGSVTANPSVTVTLADPKTNADDGRIDLSELDDVIANIGSLASIDVGGTAEMTLPVKVPFLGINGSTPTPDNTILVTIPDFGDPSTIDVVLPPALTELRNFKNMDAATLTGLLGQLTFWMDEFRHSQSFSAVDIPLVGPALDKVLGFADSFRDKLLIDDNDNGLDDAKTLLFDINAALEASGLGDKIRAENSGGLIKLIALDSGIGQFHVTGGTALGFAASVSSSGLPGDVFESILAGIPVNAQGRPGADVTLMITIDAKPAVQVKILKTDTDANEKVGDDRWKLVNAQNAPTFQTVDELKLKLIDILGTPNLAYNQADDTLTFQLKLNELFGQLDLPLGFSLDELPEFLELKTGGLLRLSADGELNLKLGVFLGDAEASTKLDGSESVTQVNGGIGILKTERITGANQVRTVYGQLSGDAKFSISVNGGQAVNVTVTKLATLNNTTAQDLANDINAALPQELVGKVQAQVVTDTPGQQRVKLAGLAGVSSLKLITATGDPTVKDMGFAAQQPATGQPVTSVLIATKDLVALRGRLTGDASFNITLGGVNGGAPFTIIIPAADTATNRFSFDIVNDINAKLIPITGAGADGKPKFIEVGFSEGRLTFTTKDGKTGLSISNLVGTAASELGLAAATGDKADLTITTRAGTTYRIVLDSAQMLDDVIGAIAAQTSGNVTAQLNDRQTGLTLTDVHFGAGGPGTFKVEVTNNSTAALDLGLVREDAAQGEAADGVIEGSDIAGLTPLDRFFIQATPVGQPPLAGVGVDISTPTPITASAKVGFVGAGLTGGGALPGGKALEADLTLRLLEPAGSTDGKISLAELLNGLDDLGSLLDISLTGTGKVDFALNADPVLADMGINVSGKHIIVDASLGDPFGDPVVPPSVHFTLPDNLIDFGNVNFNFQSILAGLRALVDFLGEFESFGFLKQPLPIVNTSISDLVSVADKFGQAVEEAEANPAATLQTLEDKLKQAFGLASSSNLINLVLVHDNNGTANDTTDDFDIVKVELNVEAAFSENLGIDFDLGLPIDLGGGADLSVSGSVNLKFDVGFRVDNPTDIYLFDSTGISGALNLAGNNLTFRAAVGPLGVFVNGGSVDAHGTLPGNKLFTAGFQNANHTNGRVPIGDVDLSDLSVQVGGAIDVDLPVFFPSDSIKAGAVLFDAALSYDSATDEFTTDFNPRAVDKNGNPIALADLFAFNPADLSLLDQLLLGVDGVDLFLEGLQDVLGGEIGGFKLPLIGDKLSGAADVIGDFRTGFVQGFRDAIEGLANPAASFAAAGIGGGGGGVPTQPDPVSKILFGLLGPAGLNLLADTNHSGGPDVGDITFVTNINQPNVAPKDVYFDWDFKLGGSLLDVGAGIGFDIGIPGLGLKTTGDIHLDIDWELALGFGINFTDGFYFDIADDSELELNANVTVPGLGITGTLGFLQVHAEEDVDPTEPDPVTHLGASFAIDVFNRSDENDTKLGFSELGRIGIDAKIAADAVADLAMRLSLSSQLVPNAPINFPSVVADFLLDWGLGDRDAHEFVSISDLNGGFLKNGLKFVGFDHVGLDLGTYFSNLIGPIVEKVQEVTEPIKPFLDFLTEPIPVISQLAGPTSLLDIAEMTGLVNPGIIKAIETVDQVIDIANSLKGVSGNVILYFDQYLPGGLVIYDATANGLAPAGGIGGIDLSAPVDVKKLKAIKQSLPQEFAFLGEALDFVEGALKDGLTKMLPGGSASEGFKLPIIDNPSNIFGMLLGQPADLVTFEMAPLELKAEFSAFFSIFGPLGVSINAEFGAKFGPFKFGYDSFGITQFAASNFKNPLLLFDGLYVSDFDADGNDVAELQFRAGLWAAAELNLGIARGGVGGGLFADIDFDLHDPNQDGRVRIKEILTNVLNEFKFGEPLLSPLAMFDITGKLTAELFAFLKVNLGFVNIDEKFLITDPITLLNFESHFTRYPTLATELPGGVLQLNMGKFADQRVEGDKSDGDEVFKVKQGSDATHVLVWAPSLGIDENKAQEYEVTTRIIALGGEGNDTIDLSLVTGNYAYELEGNAGDDVIKVGSGTGAARILGGAGDDSLEGGGGNDSIFGEGGADTMRGGGGNDWLLGEGAPKDAIQGSTIVLGVKTSNGADSIFGDAGNDLLMGAGGADLLEGGAGDDIVIADGGKVAFDAGFAITNIENTNVPKGANDTVRGDAGNDTLYGGTGNDSMDGGADNDKIYGEAGTDSITGGTGHDTVFGGTENDSIDGAAGNDFIFGDDGNDLLNGGADNDWIEGGAGLDVLHGDAGNDFLFGKSDPDQLFGDAGNDYLEGGQGSDTSLGDVGNDTLVGGYGSDILNGQAGSDSYQITARGGTTTELTTAYDTGTSGTDIMTVLGTGAGDTFLLRAMADYYFPTLARLHALITKIFNSDKPEKLDLMKEGVTNVYGVYGVPDGMLDDLEAANQNSLNQLKQAITGKYVEEVLTRIIDAVERIFASDEPGKLDAMKAAITAVYGKTPVPADMFDELDDAFASDPGDLAGLKQALTDTYIAGAPGTDTGLVALLNNGGKNVERFNYRDMEGLVVNTVGGDDYVVSDDVIAATTINLGLGNDRVQVGQVFESPRDDNPLTANVAPDDMFATVAITRGFLSNGVSVATVINGGDGNDQFTVFHNVAVLNLNGNDGDDLFTVRAFALAGSTDSERARTDMKGDGGADTILYVVNAPVGIDGGDGFDTVRIMGTEFADDFVVTDQGVFGAGLNVNYVNIEKLVADGAEGDDRFFVLSTGIEVVTEIDGGLGSDSFFVGGNPSNAPIPVISNDFKGHSGVILHSIEAGSDPAYLNKKIDGVSANVADNEEDFIIVTESGGGSRVTEGAAGGDSYTIRLSRAPDPGAKVLINVLAAGLSPEDLAKGFADLEFWDGSTWVAAQLLPALEFTPGNWNLPQTVTFRAVNDSASEGTRFTFINHTASNSTDPLYAEAKLLSVKVQIDDDERAGVVITATGTGNRVLEGGFTDSYTVVLTRQPDANVTVNLTALNGQVNLSKTSLLFTTANWNVPQTITLTANDDAVVEGFHTDFISYTVASADVDKPIDQPSYLVDGDFDLPGDQPIPAEKATSFLFLRHKPSANIVITLDGNAVPTYTGQDDAVLRYQITGNTLTFYKNGNATAVSGAVMAGYAFTRPGYDNILVKDTSVDIYDNDAADVIITQTDGSTDVLEGGFTDTYSVVLSKAPAVGQTVTVKVDAVKTRTTLDGDATFEEQVTVNGSSETFLTFTHLNWNVPQFVTVAAIDDAFQDGSDTQVFAPEAQTVNKIRGPLIIEGAAGAGSLSLPDPLLIPGELNIQPSDGAVVAFQSGSGAGAKEFMTVPTQVLIDKVADLNDPEITDIFGLVGKTIELTKGPGTGVILDPTRPLDLFDRFWLITAVQDLGNGNTKLTLQNPSMVDPGQPNVTAPNSTSEFAVTSLSVNFFADEKQQVDYTFVFDEDSVADDSGALTSADGNVIGFAPVNGMTDTMTVETQDLLALGLPNNDPNILVGRKIEITVGPGLGRVWTIASIADGAPGTKVLTLTKVSGGAQAPTLRSEFRLEGGDTRGRITGFGMGPNTVIGDTVQPGGITYADMEVLQVNLGSGNDTVRVDYTTHSDDHTTRRSGVFYTLTMLNTGGGNDAVTVRLTDGQDGALSLNTQAGDDTVNAADSSLGLTVFGWDGADTITTGSGRDTVFGDQGRVDYLNGEGTIITRLGHSLPLNPVNPAVSSATATTLTDNSATFEPGSLVGLVVQAISNDGHVQFRTIVSNTANTITVSQAWDHVPDATFFYRVSTLPEDQTDGTVRGPTVVRSIGTGGAGDVINGGGGDDLIVGGAGGDTVHAGAGNDIVAGDHARFDFTPDDALTHDGPTTLVRVDAIDRALGGADSIYGDAGDDVLIAGAGADEADGGADKDLLFGDNATLDLAPASANAIKPRFRTLTGAAIYDANGLPQVGGAAAPSAIPGGLPAWANWTITLDADPAASGNDYMAGGAGDDQLFAQLGNDTVQGDGSIDLNVSATLPSVADYYGTGTDGDDYVEGNAGQDVILGGLGQDDLIGGSSDLFSYNNPALRADGADVIFGGAGTALARNNTGDTSSTGHARDADVILGDNGNIYRLVNGSGAYRSFNYDNYAGGLRIIPRAVRHLDYTYGGNPLADLGAADLLHGEAGDDSIYGTVGNDVLFGEGQDDDLFGGAGHDRIYAGAGEDGVIGDDGLLLTSRNGLTEPLNGLNAVNAQSNVTLPGPYVGFWAFITGRLNKAAWLLAWTQGGNDVIYGGLGDDFLHGGQGNDAISGAEAQAAFYTDAPVVNTAPIAYDPVTRKLAGFDASNPLKKINNFLLNFDATGPGNVKIEDGKDRLFGDVGHDWLVGGTNNDRLFGGAGDDVLNADDNQDSQNGLNNAPDSTLYADRDFAYGGDGLDVLIANTGGDRLYDWSGEFNSFFVPFSIFGSPSVNRFILPGVPEFLLALGKESGADQTRVEPGGELGLFVQGDPQWNANTGNPRDPQPGTTKAKIDTQGAPEDDRGTALPLSTFAVSAAAPAPVPISPAMPASTKPIRAPSTAAAFSNGSVLRPADVTVATGDATLAGRDLNSIDLVRVRRGFTPSARPAPHQKVRKRLFAAADRPITLPATATAVHEPLVLRVNPRVTSVPSGLRPAIVPAASRAGSSAALFFHGKAEKSFDLAVGGLRSEDNGTA